ncbi:MAG: GNAT family N-acetyltransferase [Saprospiraceae bacterium]|nr:GNAT family N-acetyltransferase [Saprospiraceae bacterium]
MKYPTSNLDQNLVRALEYSEVQYWKKYYNETAPLTSYASVIGGGMAFAVPQVPILAMNRVVGLGLGHPITKEVLETVLRFYHEAGVKRFFVQLSPAVLSADTYSILQASGFRHYNNWTKHFRSADKKLTIAEGSFPVLELRAEDASQFGELICSCFDWNYERLDQWLNQSIGAPGYKHYAVQIDEKMVGIGALHVEGVSASMAFAATLPAYRGLGIQQQLLQKRIEVARELGCRYLVSETAEETNNKPVTSARNMRRLGFEIAYQRQNWIFEF